MIQSNHTAVFVPAGITIARKSLRGKWNSLAQFLADEVIPRNAAGFTFDPRSWSFPEFDERVYIVSLEGYERRFDPLPTQEDVRSWLVEVAHLLYRRDVHVGGWLDPKNWRFYLDASVPVRGRYRAERIGRITGQSTIYHPATDTVIPVRRTKAA